VRAARLIRSKGSTHDALGQVIIKNAMQDRLPDWNSGSALHRMAFGSSARGENPSAAAIATEGYLPIMSRHSFASLSTDRAIGSEAHPIPIARPAGAFSP
jgi:hypothetical protein